MKLDGENARALRSEAMRQRGERIARQSRGTPKGFPVLRMALLGFGVLIVLALLGDAFLIRKRSAAQSARYAERVSTQYWVRAAVDWLATTNRFVDASLRLSVPVPIGWSLRTGERAAPYSLRLLSPDKQLELNIQSTEFKHYTFDYLMAKLRHIEYETSSETHIEEVQHKGLRAAKRTCRSLRQHWRMLDFLDGGRAYHILFSAPPEYFQAAQPLMDAWFELIETSTGFDSPAVHPL